MTELWQQSLVTFDAAIVASEAVENDLQRKFSFFKVGGAAVIQRLQTFLGNLHACLQIFNYLLNGVLKLKLDRRGRNSFSPLLKKVKNMPLVSSNIFIFSQTI